MGERWSLLHRMGHQSVGSRSQRRRCVLAMPVQCDNLLALLWLITVPHGLYNTAQSLFCLWHVGCCRLDSHWYDLFSGHCLSFQPGAGAFVTAFQPVRLPRLKIPSLASIRRSLILYGVHVALIKEQSRCVGVYVCGKVTWSFACRPLSRLQWKMSRLREGGGRKGPGSNTTARKKVLLP